MSDFATATPISTQSKYHTMERNSSMASFESKLSAFTAIRDILKRTKAKMANVDSIKEWLDLSEEERKKKLDEAMGNRGSESTDSDSQ